MKILGIRKFTVSFIIAFIKRYFEGIFFMGLMTKLFLQHQKWMPNLYFDFDIKPRSKEGHILAYQGIDDLSKTGKLMEDAKKLFEEMKSVLERSINIMGFTLFIYYFNRSGFAYGTTVIFTAYIKNGQLTDFQALPLQSDDRNLCDLDLAQLEKLRSFGLKPTQHFIPYYLKKSKNKKQPAKPKKVIDTLCLVNIVDDQWLWLPFSWLWMLKRRKESKKQFAEVHRFILPGGPFKRVVIKFQNRFDPFNKIYYTYHIR